MSSRRGGRGGGSRNPANLPREQQVSRKVSWLLRHGAQQEGLKLGKGGYVNVQDALNTKALKSLQITFPELRSVVRDNDKQRFSMIPASSLDAKPSDSKPDTPAIVPPSGTDPQIILNTVDEEDDDPANFVIRANQGHSIKVDTEGLLTPITEENLPDMVVHGTDEKAWGLILKSGGLRRMGRTHIHFASGLPAGFKTLSSAATTIPSDGKEPEAATPVISGMRKGSTVLIFIDAHAAMQSGIKFSLSENKVVLTEGDDKGFVPYEFFKRVESRKGGGRVLMENGTLPEGTQVDFEAWKAEVGDVDSAKGKGKGGGRGGRKGGRGGGKARLTDDSRDVFAGV